MKTWIMVTVSPEIDHAHLTIERGEKLKVDRRLNYTEGMKYLRLAEKLLGKCATLNVNYRNYHLCYKEIHGFIK